MFPPAGSADFPGGFKGLAKRPSFSCVAAMQAAAVAKAAERAERAAASSDASETLSSLTSFMAQIVTSCMQKTASCKARDLQVAALKAL